MARIFDGKRFSEQIEKNILESLGELGKPSLNLHTIFIGENTGSEIYLRMKERSLKRIGGTLTVHRFPETANPDTVISEIESLNNDPDTHGIMIELPLPGGWDVSAISSAISPDKDVDVQNPLNIGRIVQGRALFVPPTPMAIMKVLDESGIELMGTEVCVVNHSVSIGRPVSLLLLQRNATVHICHVFTKNLGKHSANADILIVAAGVPDLIRADMVKEGSVIIDVGMNRVNGKVTGDVDFDAVGEKAAFITPVPGGIGPVTRYTLLSNLLKAYEMMR